MKNCKQNLSLLLGLFIVAFSLTACGSEKEAKLVNTQTISAKAISNISLDYDADDLHIENSSDKAIILKEYLSKDKQKYYSTIDQKNHTISMKEGKRPLGTTFKSKMILTIPKDYQGKLNVHSTSGRITTELSDQTLDGISLDTTSGVIETGDLKSEGILLGTTSGKIKGNRLITKKNLHIQSTSGPLEFELLKAKEIELQTTSAKAQINEAKGSLDYETKSGNLTLENFSGSGKLIANGDGKIRATLKEITNHLSVFSKNGDITLKLPNTETMDLFVKTKEGKIDNQRQELSERKDSHGKKVEVETRNGDITVN